MSQLLPANHNWVVAVVHGVGTQLEGETSQAVCRAIRSVSPDFRMADARADVPNEANPVVHGRTAAQSWTFGEAGRAKVAEVYWGDLVQIHGNAHIMLRAVGYNLHGAIHLCKSALKSAGPIARLLLFMPFYLLRWVILPLHLLALGIALPFGLWMLFWETPRAGVYLTPHKGLFLTLALSYAAAGILAGIYMIQRQHHKLRPPPWDLAFAFAAWSALSALFISPSLLARLEECEGQAKSIAEAYGTASAIMDLALGRFGLIELCKWIITETDMGDPLNPDFGKNVERLTGIGRYIAINELASDTAFLLCAAAIVLMIVLTAASALLGRSETARVMLLVATICSLVVGIFAILTGAVDILTRLVQFSIGPTYVTYFYEYGLMAWLAVLFMGAAVAFMLRRRELLAAAKGDGARFDYSRVIVSRLFQITVVVVTLARIALDASGPYLQDHYPVLVVIGTPTQLVTFAFLACLAAVIIFSKPLRLGLDVAMDIIDHFVRSGRELSIRNAIRQRFYDVLDRLIADGDRPHLLVVAHSQGSVITVDALIEDIWNKPHVVGRPPLSERVSSMTVLTFGSPLTHIYQHYFPKDYGPLSGASLKELAADERVQWINIFRQDDPVGTLIEGASEDFPRNVAIPGGGGHTRYWEQDVFASPLVRPHLPSAAPEGSNTASTKSLH